MGIVKMFNLYVSADTDNETNLLIETREDFYQTGSANVVDWSQKLDHNKEMIFKPMGALDSKEYEYKYKIDKDYYNTLYNSTWNQVYGEKDHVVTNDFLKNTYSLEVIFSPTPSVGQQWYDRVIPTIIKYDDKKGAQQTQSNIRILQWGGLKATAQIWAHNGSAVSDFKTSYPYAGMYDDPYTPTIDIGFGFTRQIFWDDTFNPITWTNNNLYNKYYSKFIEEITNVNSKIVTAYFYLKPTDIRNLSFRKIYRFNNAYFRLNKIENYNPTSPLTKCEFLKLKDANVFSPSTTLANGGLAELSGVAVPTYNNGNYTLKNGNSIGDKEVTAKGSNNYVNKSAVNIDIKGDDNKIFSRTKNIIIIGSGNTIQSGVENVSLINTNNLSVSISNTSFINGVSHNQGSMANVSVDTTAVEEVQTYLVDTTAGTVRITLPASPNIGKVWNFKKLIAANTLQVSPTSPSLIDGSATKNLTGIYDNLTIQWDGINFNII